VLGTCFEEESVRHLFFDCPFAVACWNSIKVVIPLNGVIPDTGADERPVKLTLFHECYYHYELGDLDNQK
jgi:hypothetical protein